MAAMLVPELGVRDWARSRWFYVEALGFAVKYERPEEGFSYLTLGAAELMIDQIGVGRDFVSLPRGAALGQGMNLQIEVVDVAPILAGATQFGAPIVLPLEDKWYRIDSSEGGNRQFAVADPDGYVLRFFQDLGQRVLVIPPAGC